MNDESITISPHDVACTDVNTRAMLQAADNAPAPQDIQMTTPSQQTLFSPYKLGELILPNRVVMASLTRGRASNVGLTPTSLHVEYYRQRASAGLIMTEGIWVSPQAIGFINVPGLFTTEQVTGWRVVTDAVHSEGGRIYAQLAHSGPFRIPTSLAGSYQLDHRRSIHGYRLLHRTDLKTRSRREQ
jgi:hypothetical protein